MPEFDYKARRKDGTIETGSLDAADRRQAIHRLQSQSLSPVTVTAKSKGERNSLSKFLEKGRALKAPKPQVSSEAELDKLRSKSPKRERIGLILLKRLLELHSSGMPIGDAIKVLSQRISNPEQKELATAIWRDLSEGATLATALNRQPRYFASSVSFVIEAGEATGSLAPILAKVIEYLEERDAIRKKMLASMAYPLVVCTFALGVVILFITVLLPRIQDMMNKIGGEMTWSARILMDGSSFLINFGPYILIALILAFIGFQQWRRTEAGLKATDQLLLRLPFMGRITLLSDLFQAGNLISTLLESGINTTETLRLTERTIQNTQLRERFNIARGQINEGLGISQAFKRNRFMPDIALDILAVGEDTGHLGKSMDEITRGFRDELSRRLAQLTMIVSSAALFAAFVIVALIAIGIVTSVMGISRELSM
ncbi:type II secretion system F family protein [Coraliomargarita akajimensis]|uniref:Type II secretion system F domain protein n=1 Tax=Coraliomargarita akajimensis (strain DSM 45221 / IAM 15411 / JCM 23193 / KCTC 12865 / 04OKA010-24) TaxID=583355 RepID=D5ENF4_CORAD|nr:type II secretion system F family protein [Coraliomargarita akajimensis]ADE55430.1 Type II secretion system F domain protein [Coraliomargarita akajimensis DSM 45221]